MKNFRTIRTFETMNYSVFLVLKGNRPIDESNVKSLLIAFKKYIAPVIIIVNRNYKVIDGQHRIEVLKRLGLPVVVEVKVIDCNDEEALALTKIYNNKQKKWTQIEWAQSFIGSRDYEIFIELSRKYKVPSTVITLYSSSVKTASMSELFRTGGFKSVDISTAIKYLDMYQEVYDASGRTQGHNKAFAGALLKIFKTEGYKHKHFLSKIPYNIEKLSKSTFEKDHSRAFEYIYNWNRKDGGYLRFF